MRKWAPPAWRHGATGADKSTVMATVVGQLVEHLGAPTFSARLLATLHPLLPAASWSVYRVGAGCMPRLYLSASLGIPDTTRDCWHAYLSGPIRDDRSLGFESGDLSHPQLCHITAVEVPREHRSRVYEAHGMAERLSVVEPASDGGLFAVNFYRHAHQQPLSDGQIADFEQLAPVVLALARKQVVLTDGPGTGASGAQPEPTRDALRQRLCDRHAALTTRELDVCTRLLQGMTHDGIAADLGLSVATVKTYRNRAFNRLGIHFRSELFAAVAGRRA